MPDADSGPRNRENKTNRKHCPQLLNRNELKKDRVGGKKGSCPLPLKNYKIINSALTLGCPMWGWRNNRDPKENWSFSSGRFSSSLECTVITHPHKLVFISNCLSAMKERYQYEEILKQQEETAADMRETGIADATKRNVKLTKASQLEKSKQHLRENFSEQERPVEERCDKDVLGKNTGGNATTNSWLR